MNFSKFKKKAVTTNSIYEQGSLYSINAIHFKTDTIFDTFIFDTNGEMIDEKV